MRTAIVYATALVLAVLIVWNFYKRGGPYFEIPETVADHMWVGPKSTRDAILACRRARPHLPVGAEVTVIVPSQAPNFDATLFLTAVGELPDQQVVGPAMGYDNRSDLPDYVIALREPFAHDAYRLVTELPGGYLYSVAR